MWIEEDEYVGLDRRRARALLRLRERRRHDAPWSETPSPAMMVRQLRAAAFAIEADEQRQRFMIRLDGAIGLAALQGASGCVSELVALRRVLGEAHDGDRRLPGIVDDALSRAAKSCEACGG